MANADMNRKGSVRPTNVFSRPRFLIMRKLGSAVKMPGIIMVARNREKTLSRPDQRSRAKA